MIVHVMKDGQLFFELGNPMRYDYVPCCVVVSTKGDGCKVGRIDYVVPQYTQITMRAPIVNLVKINSTMNFSLTKAEIEFFDNSSNWIHFPAKSNIFEVLVLNKLGEMLPEEALPIVDPSPIVLPEIVWPNVIRTGGSLNLIEARAFLNALGYIEIEFYRSHSGKTQSSYWVPVTQYFNSLKTGFSPKVIAILSQALIDWEKHTIGVSQENMGLVIGKKGATIKKIEKDTGITWKVIAV